MLVLGININSLFCKQVAKNHNDFSLLTVCGSKKLQMHYGSMSRLATSLKEYLEFISWNLKLNSARRSDREISNFMVLNFTAVGVIKKYLFRYLMVFWPTMNSIRNKGLQNLVVLCSKQNCPNRDWLMSKFKTIRCTYRIKVVSSNSDIILFK